MTPPGALKTIRAKIKPALNRRDYWPILKDFWKEFREAQVALVAASLAYTTILSIVPFLAVSFSIFKAFKGLDKFFENQLQPMIMENLAESAGTKAIESIQNFISNIHAGTLGVTGLIALIFTSMSMLSSAENAINRIWKTETKRPFFSRISSYWLFITAGPISLAAILGAAGLSDNRAKILPAGVGGFLVSLAFLASVYKFVPNQPVRWRAALAGGLMTAVAFALTKWGYGIYVRDFVSYNKIYGSLAAIPILILWIFICWAVILSGAAISASIQKRL